MYKQINSTQNSHIKFLSTLKEKSRIRKKEGLFLIEGQRELSLALKGGYEITQLFFCDDLISIEDLNALLVDSHSSIEKVIISNEVYQKLAFRGTTEGILAVAKTKELHISSVELSTKKPLILVAEAPEKPGNIGALLRTADAANVDLVCIANPKTDMYNPNIIRSSVGCLFTTPIAVGTTEEILDYLKGHNINIYGAALQASVAYHTLDYTKPTAIVVGTEATGLSSKWIDNTTQNIIIPMSGAIDSMNVSVAAGILIFEAKRQRNFTF
ncbi:TrmH family RNA methyltransferase [Aquimarina rhabdastrellae]